MKIAHTPHHDEVPLGRLAFGRVFRPSDDNYYQRTNPAVHLDASYGWGTRLADGMLTKFGLETPARPVEGEFVPH